MGEGFTLAAAAPWRLELSGDILRLHHGPRLELQLPWAGRNLALMAQAMRPEPPSFSAPLTSPMLREATVAAAELFGEGAAASEVRPFVDQLANTISLKNALDALFRLRWFQHHSLGLLYVHQKGEARAWQIGAGEGPGAGATHTIDVERFNQLHTAAKKSKTGQFSTQGPRWSWLPFGGAFLAETYGFRGFSAVLLASRQEFLPFSPDEVERFHRFAGLLGLWLEDLIAVEFSDLRLAEVMLLLVRHPLPLVLRDPDGQTVLASDAFTLAEASTEPLSWLPLGRGYALGIGEEPSGESAGIDVIHRHKIALLGDLFNTLGHELSNPLFGLGLAAEILIGAAPDVEARTILSEIRKNVQRCQSILQNLTRLYTDQAQEGTCDLRHCVREAMTLAKSELKGVRTWPTGLNGEALTVEGRPVLVVQILFNLIVNSAQALHGRPAPRIDVSVHEDEGQAWVVVADNGPGLPPHVRQNLFRPFTTSKARGHGLGLALSQNLAVKAGGDLESMDPPEGASFRLRLKKVRA